MKKTGKKGAGVLIALLIAAAALGAALFLCVKYCGGVKKLFIPLKYKEELIAAADRYGLDRRLVAAVVNTESGFKPDAVSKDGAEGLMQVLPSTAEWEAGMRGISFEEGSLFRPEVNLDYGCWLLRFFLDRYGGSVRCALIAYNAGPGKLEEWLGEGLDPDGDVNDIPYAETRNYVKKVTDLIDKYGEVYGSTLES